MAQSKLLRKVFDDLDADKSGTIDVEEVRGSLRRLGMKYDDGAVTKLIKRIDVDGNGKIDFNEWQVTNTNSRPFPLADCSNICARVPCRAVSTDIPVVGALSYRGRDLPLLGGRDDGV
jgi:hypothetical protein